MLVFRHALACCSIVFALATSFAAVSRAQDPRSDQDTVEDDADADATASDAPSTPDVIDVTIRGAAFRPPTSHRDPTAASTVISGQALRSPGRSTAEVLTFAPGVQLSRTGSAADMSTASLRGASSAQTPVLLAGICINEDVAGIADLSLVPLWMIDRIEVYRGNAPEFVDQLGIGGAVLFEPRLPKESGVGAGLGIGSYGDASAWVAGTLRTQPSATLLALRHAQARNNYPYTDDAGTRFDTTDDVRRNRTNSDFSSNDAWAITRHRLGGGSDITVIANAFEREQGVTGLALHPAQHTRLLVRRFLGGITARSPCAQSEFGEAEGPCLLTLTSSAVIAQTRTDDPLREFTLASPRLTVNTTRFTQQGRIHHRVRDVHEVSLFGSLATEHLSVDNTTPDSLHASRITARAAGSTTIAVHPSGSIHAIAGTECHSTQGPSASSSCGTFEPFGRIGAKWNVTSWFTVLANGGRYIRPPTLGELYGTSAMIRGTPTLDPEVGTNVDAGIRLTRQGDTPKDLAGYVEAFAFTRWVDALVAYQRTSFGSVRPFNVGSARIAGVEIACGGVFMNHFANHLAVTLLDPKDTTHNRNLTNDILPFRSRLALSNRLEVFSEPAMPAIRLDRVAFAILAQHRSSRFADPAGLIVIAPHTTLDFEFTGHLLNRRVTAQLAVRNALDHPQFDTIGYPLPTRSFHADVETWF